MTDISRLSNEELLSQLSDAELRSLYGQATRAKSPYALESPAQFVVDTISNIPESGINLVGGLINAVAHPIDTAKSIGYAAAGGIDAAARGLEKITTGGNVAASQPGWESARQVASAIGDMYSGRYGGIGNILNTIKTDPVGAMADASMLLRMSSGTLRTAGLKSAADSTMKVAQGIDPFSIAASGARKAGQAAGEAYKYVAGASSSIGKSNMDKAMEGSKAFLEAKAGKITDEMVVKDARNAIDIISENKNAEFAKMVPQLQSVKTNLDVTPIHNKILEWTHRFGGKIDKSGNPTFSGQGSRVAGQAATEMESIIGEMRKTTSFTPENLDALRQRLGQLSIETPRAGRFVSELTEKIREVIEPAVPGYSAALREYGKSSELINELRKSLSLGEQRTIDTAIRKLIITAKEDSAFRGILLKDLDYSSGGDLLAKIAGRSASPVMSGRLGTMATAVAAGSSAMVMNNPGLLAIMSLASPKLASWGATQLGRVGRASDKYALGSVAKYGTPVQRLADLAAQDIENERNRNK